MRRLFIIFQLVNFCFGALVYGAESGSPPVGLPVIRRNDLVDAPISGPVSALVQTTEGTRWIGSNFLAAYDGVHWETITLPQAYAFRALAPDPSGRLWVGAIGALGTLVHDPSGSWHFTSLLAELKRDGGPTPGDIWHVFPLGQGAVFVTTEWILRWNGQKFDCWQCPGRTRLLAYPRGDQVLVYQEGVGLLRLGPAGDPVIECAENQLPEHPLTWHVALSRGEALLGLADSAYRRTSDGKLTVLPELSIKLRGSIPSCAVRVRDNLVAIGTFKQGVVFANAVGAPINAIGGTSGLSDDSVYALNPEPDGTLSVGTANGTVCLEPPDDVTAFDARSGVKGTPIKVLSHQGLTYALTSKTVYDLNAVNLASTLGPEPRLWDAAVVGNNVWIGGFGGLWRKDRVSWVHEYHVSGDVSRLTAVSRLPDTVVFLEGYDLKALQPGDYGWVSIDLGQSVADTPLSLLEDASGDLWVSTLVKGIYRFTWTRSETKARPLLRLVAHYRSGYGLSSEAARPQLVRLGDRLFAFCANEILQLNRAGTGFEPVKDLGGLIGLSATSQSIGNPSTAYWLVRSRQLGSLAPLAIIRVNLGANARSPIEFTPIRTAGLHALLSPARIDWVDAPENDALWIAEKTGFLRIAPSGLRAETGPPAVTLREVRNGEERLSLNPSSLPPLPSRTHHLTFYFSCATSGESRDVFYQTRLSATDSEWSTPSAQPIREYEGLAPGRQVFTVRAIDRFGRAGPPVSCVFTILTPPYRHPVALGFYGLAAAGAGIGFTRWRSTRLRRQNQRLNELVTERTRELELSNTAKSEFLENVSHEIRNPLNGLTGMLALLQDGDLKPAERELAQSLKACADDLTRVSEEVLGYSKLEYGYVALQPRPFHVKRLFNELIDLFRGPAAQSGATFKVELGDDFVDGFVGDDAKIRTVLGNFIGNALKYAPASRVSLTAEASPIEGRMIDLFFEVTDQGPGVPPAEQELIFQKFIRGSAAKQSQVPGTGLGLATCRMLAKAMNGSVGLETPSTGGATFFLRVLVTQVAPPKMSEKIQGLAPSATGQRVLIVEDEPYNRTVLRGVALELGFAPTLTATAQEAISALATSDFDVVFLDWELPGAKGNEVARHLRSQPTGAESIIVATTAHDSDEIRRSCAEAGMDGFLLKPYSKEQIRHLIDDLRSRRTRDRVEPASLKDAGAERDSLGLKLEAFAFYCRGKAGKQGEAQRDYVAAVEEELGLIHRHIVSGKTVSRVGAAHRLRALAGLIGARDLGHIARQLETDYPLESASLLRELDRTWEQLKAELVNRPLA